MKKKTKIMTAGALALELATIGGLSLTSASDAKGIGHKTEVNYYYDAYVSIEDDLLPYYEVRKPDSYDCIYIPYENVYVFHQDEVVVEFSNILKETIFKSSLLGWVYIYCTKANPTIVKASSGVDDNFSYCDIECYPPCYQHAINGKVVARFWCDKVETYSKNDTIRTSVIEKTCLTSERLWSYAGDKELCFIHISDLEAFDKPEELKGKAPQSWRYLTFKEEKTW